MDLLERYKKFVELADTAKKIQDLPDASWETKYELIFSQDFQSKVSETGIRLDYYDPDADYEDDVRAYVSAIVEKAKEFRSLTTTEVQV